MTFLPSPVKGQCIPTTIMVVAFAAATQGTYHPAAQPHPLQQANQLQPSHQMERANIPLLRPMAVTSASTGLHTPPAHLALNVEMCTAVQSVASHPMELHPAAPESDPRCITTPLIPDRIENLLCKYDILSDWSHILSGLRTGFDVGIHEPPAHTCIFRQPQLSIIPPHYNRSIHYFRAESWPLLTRLLAPQA